MSESTHKKLCTQIDNLTSLMSPVAQFQKDFPNQNLVKDKILLKVLGMTLDRK